MNSDESKNKELLLKLVPIFISNAIGLGLILLGFSLQQGKLDIVPKSLQFSGYEIVLMVMGGILLASGFYRVIRMHIQDQKENPEDAIL